MNEETPSQFPQYQPPAGIPHADRKQSSPLFKLAKFMAKPKTKAFRSPKARKSGKRQKFY